MNYLIGISVLVFIILLSFLPLVGAYIGIQQVINNDNNKWQNENRDAYLIHNGR